MLVDDHTTKDIVNAIESAHKEFAPDYDGFAKEFWAGSPYETARALFDFEKRHMRYDAEPEHFQSVRSPGAILHDAANDPASRFDCKHYASFINGVVCALRRKGFPIQSHYRFVSDDPNRAVHHVFAVVTDGRGGEWWVDPVLSSFNTRPQFYNTKDLNMGLYKISGFEQSPAMSSAPYNLPLVNGIGKKHAAHAKAKHHSNVLKKIAHGFKVNAANAGHLALKVNLAPARGSFLALVDLNAFNLAHKLHDTLSSPKGPHLLDTWKRKFGGDEKKLRNAINNGFKHYAKHHGGAKAVHGTAVIIGAYSEIGRRHGFHPMSFEQFVDSPLNPLHPGVPMPGAHKFFKHHWHPSHLPHSIRGVQVTGCRIGFVVAIPAMMALATAIIAALKQFIHFTPAEEKQMADASKQGTAGLVESAASALDAQSGGGGGAAAPAPGGDSGGMTTSVSTNAQGETELQIHDVDHPLVNDAGTPATDDNMGAPQFVPGSHGKPAFPGGTTLPAPYSAPGMPVPQATPGDDDSYNPKDITQPVTHLGSDMFQSVERSLNEVWTGYKKPIMFAVAGIGVVALLRRKKKRRR
jgi:hypothetical protein